MEASRNLLCEIASLHRKARTWTQGVCFTNHRLLLLTTQLAYPGDSIPSPETDDEEPECYVKARLFLESQGEVNTPECVTTQKAGTSDQSETKSRHTGVIDHSIFSGDRLRPLSPSPWEFTVLY